MKTVIHSIIAIAALIFFIAITPGLGHKLGDIASGKLTAPVVAMHGAAHGEAHAEAETHGEAAAHAEAPAHEEAPAAQGHE